MAQTKQRVAVFFGGRSPEHDVSIVTGLQVLNALDPTRFESFPVYVGLDGRFWCGDALRNRQNYIPSSETLEALDPVEFTFGASGKFELASQKKRTFRSPTTYPLDFAMPAFHGAFGEDGGFQGMMDWFGIPYAGMRTLAASLLMDKSATKIALAGTDIQMLDSVTITKPKTGLFISPADLKKLIGDLKFPLIIKPVTLGSSIGVAKVADLEELSATLPALFRLDKRVIIEHAVPNLVEYNVAVSRAMGDLRLSAIERPKHQSELLDFKEKYMSNDGKVGGGSKVLGAVASEGMLSLTREINPKIKPAIAKKINAWSRTAFDAVIGSGAPRIDYLCDEKTGEIWLNEINACPGSFGYFLWEAAEQPVLFPDMLTALIDEGLALSRAIEAGEDAVPKDARLFPRK